MTKRGTEYIQEEYFMKKIGIIVLGFLIFATSALAQVNWRTDRAHTEIQFKVKHMVISTVTGEFRDYTINFSSKSDEDFTDATIEVVLKSSSIFTDNERRDNDLRSDNFLDAEKYPDITFKSNSFKKKGDTIYSVIGDLTIRDITKSVELTAEYGGSVVMRGRKRIAFHITGEVDRFEYNVKFNAALETGGLIAGNIVKFDFNLEFILQTDSR